MDPERCGYPSDQVYLLTGAGATRDKVLASLDLLSQQIAPTDTFVFYFSGHGYKVASTMGEVYYLLPHGYALDQLYRTAISDRELTEKLRAIRAQKLLVLLDCCHAGGVGEAKAPGMSLVKSSLPPEAVAFLGEGSGRVLIASSKEAELSYAGKPYSAFTLALVEALSGDGVAAEDGYVRVADIALHAREVVPGRTQQRQHPVLNFEHSDNFVVAYYAGGEKTPKGVPFSMQPEIEPEPGAWTISQKINTGGGAYIGGNVTIRGGGFVGRDSITITGDGNVIGDHSRTTVIKGARERDVVADTFERFYAALSGYPALAHEDRMDLRAELEELEEEVARGSQAREDAIARYLRRIGRISPMFLRLVIETLRNSEPGFPKIAQSVALRMQDE
jgi:hypothetical protein